MNLVECVRKKSQTISLTNVKLTKKKNVRSMGNNSDYFEIFKTFNKPYE